MRLTAPRQSLDPTRAAFKQAHAPESPCGMRRAETFAATRLSINEPGTP